MALQSLHAQYCFVTVKTGKTWVLINLNVWSISPEALLWTRVLMPETAYIEIIENTGITERRNK